MAGGKTAQSDAASRVISPLLPALHAWIEAALPAVDDRGMPTRRRPVASLRADGSWVLEERSESDLGRLLSDLKDNLVAAAAFQALCEQVQSDTPARIALILQYPDAPDELQRLPGWLFETTFRRFLGRYLLLARQAKTLDIAAFDEAASELDAYLADPRVPDQICVIVLDHLEVDGGPFALADGVSVRKATQDEQATEVVVAMTMDMGRGVFPPSAYLEVRYEKDLNNLRGISQIDQERIDEKADAAVLSLRLSSKETIGEIGRWGLSSGVYPAVGTEGWRTSSPSKYFFGPAPFRVTREIADLAAAVYPGAVRALRNQRLHTTLDRFAISYERGRAADRLIDYWVAIESIFLPESHAERMTAVVAQAAAFYLGINEADRLRISKLIEESHQDRSAVVHGRTLKDPSRVDRIVEQTGALVRSALRRVLQEPL